MKLCLKLNCCSLAVKANLAILYFIISNSSTSYGQVSSSKTENSAINYLVGIQSGSLSNFDGLKIDLTSLFLAFKNSYTLTNFSSWNWGVKGVIDVDQNHIYQQSIFTGHSYLLFGNHAKVKRSKGVFKYVKTSNSEFSITTSAAYNTYSYRGESLGLATMKGSEINFWGGFSIRSLVGEKSSVRFSFQNCLLNLSTSSELIKFSGNSFTISYESYLN